jgi:hypothetical protein
MPCASEIGRGRIQKKLDRELDRENVGVWQGHDLIEQRWAKREQEEKVTGRFSNGIKGEPEFVLQWNPK